MKNIANLSFLGETERVTLYAYHAPRGRSICVSECVSRLAACILLSPAAALDIVMHTLLLFPMLAYAIGKSIYHCKSDFSIPWQHLQRIRNAVAPLLLGSVFGLIHPFAGLAVSEPTDKHIILGILSSNTHQDFETPCSPIHSLSLVEDLAKNHRYVEKDNVRREIFSPEHVKAIRTAKGFEKSLEALQAQEYIHKITNLTLFVMAKITGNLSPFANPIVLRLSGLLIPILTLVDLTIALLVQAFFLTIGIARLISGRGPIYTEVTTNPLMHVAFLIQTLLKVVGNLVGTLVFFVSPVTGFRASLLPAHLFFKAQMHLLLLSIRVKMCFAKEADRFVIPIIFGRGESSALSVPTHSSHKTYLIVEKKDRLFNLYWVDRPAVSCKEALDLEAALVQIKSMLDERFPFMDMEKLMDYPVRSQSPSFSGARSILSMQGQGNSTNCVVSNLFGTLEALDRIRGEDTEITQLRYQTVRASLMTKYAFYKDNFAPFSDPSTWDSISAYPEAAI